MRNLERRLGFVLFQRTTRSVSLAEAGGQFLRQVEPLVEELARAARNISEKASVPSGELRLFATSSAYLAVLRPALSSSLQLYPAIDVDVVLREAKVDLVLEGFDAGLGLAAQVERDLAAVSVGSELRKGAFASPDYLALRTAPNHPSELCQHECICYQLGDRGALERWSFENGQESHQIRVKSRLVHNSPIALMQAALDGLGIAYIPDGHLGTQLREGQLTRVLSDWSPPVSPYMLYCSGRRSISNRLRLLIDHLRGTTDNA